MGKKSIKQRNAFFHNPTKVSNRKNLTSSFQASPFSQPPEAASLAVQMSVAEEAGPQEVGPKKTEPMVELQAEEVGLIVVELKKNQPMMKLQV